MAIVWSPRRLLACRKAKIGEGGQIALSLQDLIASHHATTCCQQYHNPDVARVTEMAKAQYTQILLNMVQPTSAS
jgi:hypothetical protein